MSTYKSGDRVLVKTWGQMCNHVSTYRRYRITENLCHPIDDNIKCLFNRNHNGDLNGKIVTINEVGHYNDNYNQPNYTVYESEHTRLENWMILGLAGNDE